MNISILHGHPLKDSFCSALAHAYIRGALAAGATIRETYLAELDFDPVLHHGYKKIQELEPDLVSQQQDILWADHVVFAFPIWWGVPPALVKGFFDRALVPGFAYKYAKHDDLFQQKLLTGRSARIICTMDSPTWYFRFVIGAPGVKMMKNSVLKFCGFSPIRVSTFGSVKLSSPARRQKWLAKAEAQGRKDCH